MSPSGEQEPGPYSLGRSAHLTSEKSSLYQEAAGEIARGAAVVLDDWLPGFTVDAEPIIEAEAGQELVEDIAEFDMVDTRLFAVRLGQRGTRLAAELLASIEDDVSTVGGTATPVPAARMADTTTLPIWAEGGRSTVAPGS